MSLWVHVPTPFAPQQSSLFVVIQNLCTQHDAAGQASNVVVSDNREVHLSDASLQPVDYRRYCPRQWFTPREMKVDHLYGLSGRERPYSSRIFIPAVEKVRELHPEIVFLHEGHHATPSLPLWAKKLPTSSRIILYAHIPFSRGYRRRELRRLLSAAAGIIFVSEDSRDRATRFLGKLPVPAHVVNNGVDTEAFHPRDRPSSDVVRLTFAGEIAPHKGLHLLLAALHHLSKFSQRKFSLQVVGRPRHENQADPGRYELQVRAAAAAAPVDVQWLGSVRHEAMPGIFRSSDVVCVPSVWNEPFGMVALEALACGSAVVASLAGGLRDAGGDAALYVDPSDELGFARTIADIANDPARLSGLQVYGREHALLNDWGTRYRELARAVGSMPVSPRGSVTGARNDFETPE